MDTTLWTHFLFGAAGLSTGFVALYSLKGGRLHRRTGTAFVYVMLVMAVLGGYMALTRNIATSINVPAASITSYLVITGLVTVRRPAAWAGWMDIALMAVALGIFGATASFTADAIANGSHQGMTAFPFVMFNIFATFGLIGDVMMLRAGGIGTLGGAPRIARHLWRMCSALFIGSLSFFIGQSKVFPEPIRIMPLLAMPVLAVLVTMLYWIWRVRIRRSLRGLAAVSIAG